VVEQALDQLVGHIGDTWLTVGLNGNGELTIEMRLWCSDRKIDASRSLISTLMPSWLGSGQIPGVHMPACG
jgi:hypothetical protein